MRTLFCSAVLLLLAACAGTGGPLTPPGWLSPESYNNPEDGADRNDLRRVVGSEWYSNQQQWIDSPWDRPGDDAINFPRMVLINDTRQGCVVPDAIFAMQPHEVACKSGWRFPRFRW